MTADYAAENGTAWGDDDPSVFVVKTSGRLEGEFQVTNGYGPHKAPQVMTVRTYRFILSVFGFRKSSFRSLSEY